MSNGGVYHGNLELLQDIVGNVGTVQ